MLGGPLSDGTRGGSGGAVAATEVNLADATVVSDSGGFIDNITSTNVLTTTNGTGSSTTLSNAPLLSLGGDISDGLHTFDFTRDNPGGSDKVGLLFGFDDSASTARVLVGGMFETGSGNRETDVANNDTIAFVTTTALTRVKTTVKISTDASGARIIGPGWLEAYNGSALIGAPVFLDAQHTVTGTLRKVCRIRRGTSGSPVGDLDYTVTQVRVDLP
jgi:hypothetical protein